MAGLPLRPDEPAKLGANDQRIVSTLVRLHTEKKFDEAITLGLDAIEKYSNDPLKAREVSWQLDEVAWSLTEVDRVDDGIALLEKLTVLVPNDANAWAWLSNALDTHRNDTQGALAVMRRAVVARPDSAFVFAELSRILRKLKELDESLEHAHTAVRLDPSNATARYNISWALSLKGDKASALTHVREACRLDPRRWDHWYRRAKLAEYMGHADEVYDAAERLRALEPDNETHFRLVVAAATRLGNLPKALKVAAEWAKKYPKSADAHDWRAHAAFFARKNDVIEQSLARLEELAPNAYATLKTRAALAVAQSRWADAERHLETALANSDTDCSGAMLRIIWLVNTGRRHEADEALAGRAPEAHTLCDDPGCLSRTHINKLFQLN